MPNTSEPIPAGHRCRSLSCQANAIRRITVDDRFQPGQTVSSTYCGAHAAQVVHRLGIYDATMNPIPMGGAEMMPLATP